jgi:ribonuclease-3
MTRSQPPRPDREGLLKALGVAVDAELLERSLTHRSYAYENGGLPTNERLEFLGDSVLSLVVTTELYLRHPDLAEGHLAKQRASVVNQRALADVARSLGPTGVGPYLLLGRGEDTTGGRDKASILADTLEAIIGAIYLSSGLEIAGEFIHREFDPLLDIAAARGAGLDWKTSLQERSAVLSLGPPEYTVEEFGPDHAKRFTARAVVRGEVLGQGEGGSKKEAEQHAAAAAFAELEARSRPLAAAAGSAAPGTNGAATNGAGTDPTGTNPAGPGAPGAGTDAAAGSGPAGVASPDGVTGPDPTSASISDPALSTAEPVPPAGSPGGPGDPGDSGRARPEGRDA